MAIICLILCLFYYLLIEKKKGSNTWLLIIPLIVLFLGTSYYDLLYKRFFGGFEMGINSSTLDKSTITRLDRFNFAWEMFLSNPLIGQGAGYLSFIHNGFLEILGNLGIVGLFLFKPLIRPLKNIKTTFYNPWGVGLIILMISLVALESAINLVSIMYFVGLLYGGFLASTKLRTNRMYITTVDDVTQLPGCTSVIHWNYKVGNGLIHVVDNLLIPSNEWNPL